MTLRSLAARWPYSASPARLLRHARHMIEDARSRRALQRLDAHLLNDIGLTRHEAEVEAARRPWDPPLHWRD